jgi:hypothetical protein
VVAELSVKQPDVVVVGGGAAGLIAALAARGAVDRTGAASPVLAAAPDVVVLDGSPRIGLKILVSGGGRCNVTNEAVDATDFDTDAPHVVRGLLQAFPAASARRFFEGRGCPLYAEPLGKLFPRSDRARDVLDTLVSAVERAGVRLEIGAEVVDVRHGASAPWEVQLADGRVCETSRVIVATGGRSLPKTGSRGFGLDLAARLGHEVEPPLPALTPLRLGADGPLAGLAGITVPALLSLAPRGTSPEQVAGSRFRPLARAAGSLLVTHRGASGPAALDVSGACGCALAAGADVTLCADFWSLSRDDSPFRPFRDLPKLPGASLAPRLGVRPVGFDEFGADVRASARPGRSLANELAARLPRALVDRLLAASGQDPTLPVEKLSDGQWRRVHRALTCCDLRLCGTDGYDKAEVTRGGVRLAELGRTTLESRRHAGLWFCGEVVHATGRLGGFNFQWAWSSGFAAGAAAGRS